MKPDRGEQRSHAPLRRLTFIWHPARHPRTTEHSKSIRTKTLVIMALLLAVSFGEAPDSPETLEQFRQALKELLPGERDIPP